MIKAKIATAPDGEAVYLLGVTEGNVARLREGRPLMVDLRELGGTGKVAIVYGSDKPAILDVLERDGVTVPDRLRRYATEHPE